MDGLEKRINTQGQIVYSRKESGKESSVPPSQSSSSRSKDSEVNPSSERVKQEAQPQGARGKSQPGGVKGRAHFGVQRVRSGIDLRREQLSLKGLDGKMSDLIVTEPSICNSFRVHSFIP